MAKKEEIKDEVTKAPIAPVLSDFGRVDLNELRDKVNEILKRV